MLTSRIYLAIHCRQLQPVKRSSLSSCLALQGKQLHSSRAPHSQSVPNQRLTLGRTSSPLLQATFCDSTLTPSDYDWHSARAVVGARSFSTSSCRSAKELSEKGDLVYRGAISGMIRGVKLFSMSTSVIGICLQPMLLFNNQELPMGLKVAFGGMINFLVFMNPFIIHYIAKKYVTELRWNRQTGVFTAATWSFFVQRKELQFTAEDVRVPDVPGMFTFLEAKGIPLFFEPQAFEDNEAYVHLMGYDKPLDWELPQERQPPTKENSQR